ncbi:glycosyltransferase family 4 protein [Sulfurovum lithotrophicum]|nr:glycosyltransferase family 4 protein [Sulfurovum lithotrophicum]
MVPAIKEKEKGRKKRALIFTSLPLTHVGGIEKVNLQIMNMLQDAGWEVDTRSYYDLDVEKLQKGLSEGNIMVYYDHFLLAGTYDWRSYDLVVTNDSVGGVCHTTEHTKVITLVHAVFAVGFNMLEQNLAQDYNSKVRAYAEAASFRNKDQVISVSKKVQTELKEHFDADSIVINNGFDFDLFLPSGKKELNIRKEHGIPENAIVGLYAGRWSTQEKRPDITLKLAKKFPDIYWVFATDKPVRGSDEMKNVIVLHNIPYEKMPALYEEVDFTMQLSLYEGFSNFAIESIASKVPMISTRTGIIDEVYSGTDMESLLIEQSISRDVILKQAEEKVRKLFEGREFYKKASETLYTSAKKRFSLERWREQMRKVLSI